MKRIKFIAENKELLGLIERPYPAIKKLPDWVSHMPSYVGGKKGVDKNADPNSTIKKCMPVFDSMSTGYYIPLICDVWIENQGENKISLKWAWDTLPLISAQNQEAHKTYPIPEEYQPTIFKFTNPWIVKTPPGWSCLFTHPLNYDDLPFKCLPAIVSTDKFPAPVHLPFLVKKSFSGLVPKDTPLIQIIPFKREDFVSEYSYDKDKKLATLWKKAESIFFDRYKKFFRETSKFHEGEIKPPSKCPFANLFK